MSDKSKSNNGSDVENLESTSNQDEAAAEQENPNEASTDTKTNFEEIEAELSKVKKDYLYLYAEFENYRKKSIQERSQLIKYASEGLLRDLLGVMDNFELALATAEKSEQEADLKSLMDGVKMISKELLSSLEKHGVVRLSSEGEDFDPSIHEALTSEESSELESGKILRVHREAYKLHDRLLRPAQVVVVK